MAESSLTITREAPSVRSMNYALLREAGIDRLQTLSGTVWNDFNIHDPGVTILEALSYAITDLGYRSGYKMQDLLALAPGDSTDIRNFFTAYEILTNRPLTPNDYRKLLMDVEVTDDETGVKAGIKNAWLLKAENGECPFYVLADENRLSYTADPLIPGQEPVKLRGLYNVLLELDSNERFGDMNESKITGALKVKPMSVTLPAPLTLDPKLALHTIFITVDLPRWDDPQVTDWNDLSAIRAQINRQIRIDFSDYPDNYILNFSVDSIDGTVTMDALSSGIDTDRDGIRNTPFAGISLLSDQINEFLFDAATALLKEYQRKVLIIRRLVDKVCRTVMANRNLCEDFISFNAIRIEEISMCGDIQVTNDADIEEVLAQIYYRIGEFLSPTVYFRSIEELTARGLTPDQIFDGPRLLHGFIDNAELKAADQRRVIHVSDLYQIIMDVPGVVAIKNLQIANIPEDNDRNIPSQSVKWCLSLAIDYNYVPRMSPERSNITFFKDVLPFEAKTSEVLERLTELRITDRNQRLDNPTLDLPVPQGEFKNIQDYYSVQEDFPLIYGTGSVGVSDNASDERKGQVHQLKGYLIFFDQLLANYLSQLANVKNLFSLNEQKDVNGNYIIGRTYFAQSLLNEVPGAQDLFVKYNPLDPNPDNTIQEVMDSIAENDDLFHSRRNRFLDHLMARFAENFADYAMLAYTIEGPKAPEELIEDKLRFLNSYSDISYNRGGAFDYIDTCHIYSVDNLSGLEKRVALLAGIDPVDPKTLSKAEHIEYVPTNLNTTYTYEVWGPSTKLMNAIETAFPTLDDAIIASEDAINAGSFEFNYYYFDNLSPNTPIDPQNPNPLANYFFYKLYCGEGPIAVSEINFITVNLAVQEVQNLTLPSLRADYDQIPSPNRKSVACSLDEHVSVDVVIVPGVDGCPNYARIDYQILNDLGQVLLNYSYSVQPLVGETDLDLETRAESFAHELIIEFLIKAENRDNYRLETLTGDYVFAVTDNCRETIATSEEIDFNTHITAFLSEPSASFTTPVITILDENGNVVPPTTTAPYYEVETAIAPIELEDLVQLAIKPLLPTSFTEGVIRKNFVEALDAIDKDRRTFYVNEDLRARVRVGETVLLTLNGIEKLHEVVRVAVLDFTGTYRTEVEVKEAFVVDTMTSGFLEHTATLDVVAVINYNNMLGSSIVQIRPGTDTIAIDEFIEFIKRTFFAHEGFHLIEHILLRPLVKAIDSFEAAGDGTMASNLTTQGDLYFVKKLGILAADDTTSIFTLPGDVSAEIQFNQRVLVTNSTLNDRAYTVLNVNFNGTDTEVKVVESISLTTGPDGDFSYTRMVPINAILPNGTSVELIELSSIDLTAEILMDAVIIIRGSQYGRNDTRYVADTVIMFGTNSVIKVRSVEVQYKDRFLSINQTNECEECRYTDPYSFTVSVVMPYWRGRFSDLDFRNFFERTLRLEAPAHIVLNVCWVDCTHMEDFEKAYRAWLFEHARKKRDPLTHTLAQNKLVDVLLRLRSVYPKGTLHDCETQTVSRSSLILNKSVLGSI
jgi:hypothetical protein